MRPIHALLLNIPLIAAASAADDAKLRTFHAQPSFVLSTKQVEIAVTKDRKSVV